MAPLESLGTPILVVKPWRDPVVERFGFPVHSPYVEAAWLPILGPSTTWALRRLGLLVAAQPAGVEVDLDELASDLGLRRGTARNAPMIRTLRRLEVFGMARWPSERAIRTTVPPLPVRFVERLSPATASMHRQMVRLRRMESEPSAPRPHGLSR
jgi:hypothetical protein